MGTQINWNNERTKREVKLNPFFESIP
jgi:hypothetical protein